MGEDAFTPASPGGRAEKAEPLSELLETKNSPYSWGKTAQKVPTSVISETHEWQSTAPAGRPAGLGEEGLGAGTEA